MLVITDTNFLIYCAKYGIFHEFDRIHAELMLPEQVLLELQTLKMSAKKGSDKEAANLALNFLKNLEEKGKLKIEKIEGKNADKAVSDLAILNKNKGTSVATHDKALMKNLKKAKISIITIRQKKYFIEG